MISTYLYELVHRLRSQGKVQQTLLVNRSEFEQLKSELQQMHCRRALQALRQPHPVYGGLPLAIQEDWAL